MRIPEGPEREMLARARACLPLHGIHAWCYRAACCCQENGLSPGQAESLLFETRARHHPRRPIPDQEIFDAVQAVYRHANGSRAQQPRHAPRRPTERIGDPDPAEIARMQKGSPRPASWRHWLYERSPARPDISAFAALDLIYPPGTIVGIVRSTSPDEGCKRHQMFYQTDPSNPSPVLPEFHRAPGDGAWFLTSPLSGKTALAGNGKRSAFCLEAMISFPYAVLESDELSAGDFMRVLVNLPIPIAMLTTTGGSGIHALWRVNSSSAAAFRERLDPIKHLLSRWGFDARAVTPHRQTRLPNVWRGSRFQKLLFLNPAPLATRMLDLPRIRQRPIPRHEDPF
jgi:hypothetical protein